MTRSPLAELVDELRDARCSLVARMAADLDAGAPEPGFVQLLAHLQTAIQAVETELDAEGGDDEAT